ncbi:MAG: hypothetical protein EBR60_06425 [Burkholderiaceae bacterium]|nr:hypothetical protein [Burkholderiaceae bacterium]
MVAVGLIFMTHLVDMIAWTYALIAVKIFEVDTNAFYFVGEMYTFIGYGTFSLPENWKIMPVMNCLLWHLCGLYVGCHSL